MPELRPREGEFRILVHVDDHAPPHVHVVSNYGSVKIRLGRDEVTLEDAGRGMKRSDIRRAREVVIRRLDACWQFWRKYHGQGDRIR